MKHADIVKNEWGAGFQERIGTITIEVDTRPDLEDKMLLPTIKEWAGSYLFITAIHSEEDCLFKETNRLNMLVVKLPPGKEHELPKLTKEDDA